MNVRLRVLVAAVATATLGVMGTVAALPASASAEIDTAICSNYISGCVLSEGSGNFVTLTTGHPTNYTTHQEITYNGEDYYSLQQDSTNLCLEWDESGTYVREATCSSTVDSQFFWWSGQRFRNLYATKIGHDACLNYDGSNGLLDLYSCSVTSSEWTY